MATKKDRKTQTTAYSISDEMKACIATSAAEHIERWWREHSTEEERAAAEERDATPAGALAFVESVVRKFQKSKACLKDELTYELAGIFLRNGSDGDTYMTQEELDARAKADEKKRAEREKKTAEAEAKEVARRAALTPEQREEEDRVKREREAKAAESAERLKERQALADEKRKAAERAKAIAKEMADRQLTFDF